MTEEADEILEIFDALKNIIGGFPEGSPLSMLERIIMNANKEGEEYYVTILVSKKPINDTSQLKKVPRIGFY